MTTSVNLPDQSIEKLPLQIVDNKEEGARYIASLIADVIKDKEAQGKKTVLGLATGSSPILIYKELIRIHKNEGLSFKNVETFNLDEYYPMNPEEKQSYV